MSWGVAIVSALLWLAFGVGVLLCIAWDVLAPMLDWLDEE